jgi:hypothetical protein
MKLRDILGFAVLVLLLPPVAGQVVINEIFYHAPDDLAGLQWIELFNNSDQPVDLAGWRLSKGVQFRFPQGTSLAARGFLVLCQNREQFQQFYSTPVLGQFEGTLKKGGGHLELRNASDRVEDSVLFSDRPPWPRGPAGHTASLERICPSARGDLPENWTGSPLSDDDSKPGGSPGQQNSAYSAALPPIVSQVEFRPARAEPDQPIQVEAKVSAPAGLKEVTLLYQVVGIGQEGEEKALPMRAGASAGTYAASIPGQKSGQIVRLRVLAIDTKSARRFSPSPTDLHPALSCLVLTNTTAGRIPIGYIIHTDTAEVANSRTQQNGPGPNPESQARFMVQMQLDSLFDLPGLWAALTLSNSPPAGELEKLRLLFSRKTAEREQLQTTILASKDLEVEVRSLPERVRPLKASLAQELEPLLNADQRKAFEHWRDNPVREGGPNGPDPSIMLRRIIRLEPAYLHLALNTNLSPTQLARVRDVYQAALQQRDALVPKVRKLMTGQRDGNGADEEDLQTQAFAIEPAVDQKLKTVLAPAVARQFAAWRLADAPPFMRKGGAKPTEAALGKSAFVYVDPNESEPKLYDFVHVPSRSGGWKVHFGKEATLHGMSSIDLIFESSDRWVLAEPLAYQLHHRAGLAAPLTDFVRLWVDGQPMGYHLLIEQPNKAFLRRNGLREDGNLYKANWTGRGLVGQNEKRTNLHSTYDDLVHLVDQLEATKANPAEQWALIKREFDVNEVINHYAVRMLISDWDGFFNNYYLYHDLHGTGKWMFFPWDEDKTWGEYDGWQDRPLYDLPLSYAEEGDRPPGWNPQAPPPRGINPGSWWRPGGYISKPVLANPEFRKLFLARMKELLNSEFREDRLFPLVDAMKARLSEEIGVRADALHEDRAQAQQRFEANLASLKEFITKRRQWLLAQKEIRNAGPFDRTQF